MSRTNTCVPAQVYTPTWHCRVRHLLFLLFSNLQFALPYHAFCLMHECSLILGNVLVVASSLWSFYADSDMWRNGQLLIWCSWSVLCTFHVKMCKHQYKLTCGPHPSLQAGAWWRARKTGDILVSLERWYYSIRRSKQVPSTENSYLASHFAKSSAPQHA